ncbi:uncharacterized protein ARMOST_20144 [Armillaria ostoyae]|uniref:Uncharacterized protein n=1 Tax=Armillaria ostoyae TaxID=47428 RepID=A0A284S6I9_ARMOS|nr:uncharacterized protein ARMOST_20144 [Armillaria ostoyae]
MFAGSANSLKSFEAWTMGMKEYYDMSYSQLSIHIGGCNHPSKDFILGELSNASRLQFINLNGDTDTGGRTRKAFAEALNREDSFPCFEKVVLSRREGDIQDGAWSECTGA